MSHAMQAHIDRLLTELGSDVPAIAAELQRREIRGVPGHPDACPIARYLKSRDVPVAYVSGMRIEVRSIAYDTPDPAAEFIEDFDTWPERFIEIVEAMP